MRNALAISLALYAFLIGLGGFLGFWIAGSLASLISSSSVMAVFLGLSLAIRQGRNWAVPVSMIFLVAICFFFAYRVYLSGKLFPGGFFSLLTLVELIAMGLSVRRENGKSDFMVD